MTTEPDVRLAVTVACSGTAVIVYANGDVDAANVQSWQQVLSTAIATTCRPGPLIIDINGLDFIAGCGFSALAEAAQRCHRLKVDMYLASNKPIVARIITATGSPRSYRYTRLPITRSVSAIRPIPLKFSAGIISIRIPTAGEVRRQMRDNTIT